MKKIYSFLLISLVLTSISSANAQTLIDGSFENCSSYGALTAPADVIQGIIFTPCNSTTNFFGNGQSFYSDGTQATNYGTQGCIYYSPPASDGIRNIGFGSDATLAIKLTTALVPGTCYSISFDGMNSPGDDGSGSCPGNTTSNAFQVGISGSAASFGTAVGTTAPLAPSLTYTYTPVSVTFLTPAGTYDYITVRLADQNNIDNMLFLDNMVITPVVCTVMPITLVDFSATRSTGCSARLNWKTASEINASHFEIQRSINGNQFVPVGIVNSNNNASGSSYQFTDPGAKEGITYYRLLMVDIDGHRKYSTIVNVSSCKNKAISIYPNPATDVINISSIKNGDLIQISNALGQVVITKTAVQNKETINTSNLPASIYDIAIINQQSGQRTTHIISKQ